MSFLKPVWTASLVTGASINSIINRSEIGEAGKKRGKGGSNLMSPQPIAAIPLPCTQALEVKA
jgi:hypothetical protein